MRRNRETRWIRLTWLLYVLSFPCIAGEESSAMGRTMELKEWYSGTWISADADQHDCFNVRFDETVKDIEVQENQIVIEARFEVDSEIDRVNIYFVSPSDLGRGGMSLPWHDMVTTKPIAVFEKSHLNEDAAFLEWHGLQTYQMANTRYEYGMHLQGEFIKAKASDCATALANGR